MTAKHVMDYGFACDGCYKDILVKNSERKDLSIALGYDRTFKKNYSIGIEYKFINKDAGEFDTVYLNVNSGSVSAQYFVDPMWSHSFRLKLGFTPYKVLNKQPSDRWFFSALSRSKVYGFLGYTEQRERIGINVCGYYDNPSNCLFTGGRADTQGFDSGIGIDTPLWRFISTRIEITRTHLDPISAHHDSSDPAEPRTIIEINRDPVNQLRIGLFYNF